MQFGMDEHAAGVGAIDTVAPGEVDVRRQHGTECRDRQSKDSAHFDPAGHALAEELHHARRLDESRKVAHDVGVASCCFQAIAPRSE
jgi:hypothetical protein